jgi:hypothetical protein
MLLNTDARLWFRAQDSGQKMGEKRTVDAIPGLR